MRQVRARLEERLAQLALARPDLERAIALQRLLLSRQLDMLEVFWQGGLPAVTLPARYLATKLQRGRPALHGEPIPLPAAVLALSAREYCDHLAKGGAGDAAAALGRALDSRALDGAALVSACFGRDQRRVRFMAAQQTLSPDLAWLVAELAAAPFAHLLVRHALAPRAALEGVSAWDRGYCPGCGSWPAIAEVVAGRHVFRCSFCAHGWTLRSYRCIYCGSDTDRFVTAAPFADQPGRRMQMCNACGGYLKVLELDAPTEFPVVAVEDLASMDLDVIAIERKYTRPALAEIGKRGS